MSEDWTVAKGTTGEVWASPGGVVIRRHGMRAMLRYGNAGEMRIPIESISAVQFKPAGMAPGWLRFALYEEAGAKPAPLNSGNDPYSMEFSVQQQGDFETIRKLVDRAIIETHRFYAPTSAKDSTNIAAEIKRLLQLREQGMLSEAQFNQQKSQLLSGG